MKKGVSLFLAGLVSASMVMGSASGVLAANNQSIVCDGDLSDWAEIEAQSAPQSSAYEKATYWKVAVSDDTIYFTFTGKAESQWDYNFANYDYSLHLDYASSQYEHDNPYNHIIPSYDWGKGQIVVRDRWNNEIEGATAGLYQGANGNTPGDYVVEVAVPLSFMPETPTQVSFGADYVRSNYVAWDAIAHVASNSSLGNKDEAGTESSENPGETESADSTESTDSTDNAPSASYTGIVIDGLFEDWKGVQKYDASCPNEAHKNCITKTAAVFDGDYFYVYIKEAKGMTATEAGSHSNGKYAIISDLGEELDFQLKKGGEVAGVEGANCKNYGDQWEISIPKSALPAYKSSFSFGLYLGETFITDIMDVQGSTGIKNTFSGITYDGFYEDWEDYKSSTIEYATAGSQNKDVDGKSDLYSDGTYVYGHVKTTMPAHLEEAGGEFNYGVTLAFGENFTKNPWDGKHQVFNPRPVTVDAAGNINWYPQLQGLAPGSYEYYLFSTDCWGNSTNINNLTAGDQWYGKMIMTIGTNGKDEMEYYLDLEKLADKFGCDIHDFRTIQAQYLRIGEQWTYCAGTSTGPILGLVLCIGTVGGIYSYRRKKVTKTS